MILLMRESYLIPTITHPLRTVTDRSVLSLCLCCRICASNFFKTLLNLFKQYCWNNFLHSQVKKCLSYAIGAYDENRNEASGSVQLEISALQRHVSRDLNGQCQKTVQVTLIHSSVDRGLPAGSCARRVLVRERGRGGGAEWRPLGLHGPPDWHPRRAGDELQGFGEATCLSRGDAE